MHCNEFRDALSATVESRLRQHLACPDLWNQLEQHAQECRNGGCRQLWEDELLLAAALPQWRAEVPPASLIERVMGELRRETAASVHVEPDQTDGQWSVTSSGRAAAGKAVTVSSSGTRPARTWLAFTASVAALLLFVVLLRTGRQSRVDPMAQTARTAPQARVRNTHPAFDPDGPAAASEVIRTLAAVPQTATDFVSSTMVWLSPSDAPEGTEMDPPGRGDGGGGGGWSEQLEPWRRELGTAFDAFLQSLSAPPETSGRDICHCREGAATA
jgi:hypothetical protein